MPVGQLHCAEGILGGRRHGLGTEIVLQCGCFCRPATGVYIAYLVMAAVAEVCAGGRLGGSSHRVQQAALHAVVRAELVGQRRGLLVLGLFVGMALDAVGTELRCAEERGSGVVVHGSLETGGGTIYDNGGNGAGYSLRGALGLGGAVATDAETVRRSGAEVVIVPPAGGGVVGRSQVGAFVGVGVVVVRMARDACQYTL